MQMTQYLKWYEYATKKPEGKCNLSLDSGRKGYSEGFKEWNAEIFMNPSICETIQGT